MFSTEGILKCLPDGQPLVFQPPPALKVEVVEQVLTPVPLARAQGQTAIALDCLGGKRFENLATSSDWDTLVFLEDIGEMTVVRSAFSVYVSRFRKFVDEI